MERVVLSAAGDEIRPGAHEQKGAERVVSRNSSRSKPATSPQRVRIDLDAWLQAPRESSESLGKGMEREQQSCGRKETHDLPSMALTTSLTGQLAHRSSHPLSCECCLTWTRVLDLTNRVWVAGETV